MVDVLATAVGGLFGWSVTGYLVWRAWPAIRSDVRRARRALGVGKRRGRYAAAGRLGNRDGAL